MDEIAEAPRRGKAVVSKKGKGPMKSKVSVQRRGSRLSTGAKKRNRSPVDDQRVSKSSRAEESFSDEYSSEDVSDKSDFEDFESTMLSAGLLTKKKQEGTIPPVPATSHVSKKTRTKILKGEFFDISRLLPTLQDEEEDIDKLEEKKLKLSFFN